MPDPTQDASEPSRPGGDFKPGPADEAVISLSQALLAPLDALAKAQVHAARSFLNLLLQIGTPHQADKDTPSLNEAVYTQRFLFKQSTVDAQGQPSDQTLTVDIPALALVPLQPLTIETAKFEFELVIAEVQHHQQMQQSELAKLSAEDKAKPDLPTSAQPRPWYLVSEPVSVRGTLSDPGDGERRERKASVKMEVQLKSTATPAALAKLLSSMTQFSNISTANTTPAPEPAPPAPNPGA